MSRIKLDQQRSRTIWRQLRKKRGTMTNIARELGLRHQTTMLWTRVPLEHVFAVSKLLHTPPEDLRPDFFRADPLRRSAFLTDPLPMTGTLSAQTGAAPCPKPSPADAPKTAIYAPNTAARYGATG